MSNPDEQITLEQYPHAEQEMAAALGLAHTTLKAQRREVLKRGEDWELVKNCVHYTGAGRAKVLAALKISDPEGDAPPPPAAAPEPDSPPNNPPEKIAPGIPGAMAVLICTKACHPNHRMVLATLEGKPQRVRVRDNQHFIAGMKMECRFVQDNLWDLAQRLPRWRGRW